jgi:hypothetical protein
LNRKIALTLLVTIAAAGKAAALGDMAVVGESGDAGPLRPTLTTLRIDIDGRIAVTRLVQAFANSSDRDVTAIYSLKLPAEAIIVHLEVSSTARKVTGTVIERDLAEWSFQRAAAAPVSSLISRPVEGGLHLAVLPFLAKSSVSVQVEYLQTLEATEGVLHYLIPATVGGTATQPVGAFALEAVLKGAEVEIAEVRGLPESLTPISREDDGSIGVLFADELVSLNKDVELFIRESSTVPAVRIRNWADPEGGEPGYFVVWLSPVDELLSAPRVPIGVTFAVDVTRTMEGDRLTGLKEVLTAIIGGLEESDLFNIVPFNSSAWTLFDEPVAATASNREAAATFLLDLEAEGAANFEAAIRAATERPSPKDRPHHIVLLTDGPPVLGSADSEELVLLIEKAGGDAQLHTVGIGDQAPLGLLREIAHASGGITYAVPSETGLEAALAELMAEISHLSFVVSELDVAGIAAEDVYPRLPWRVAAGEEIFLAGRYTGEGTAEIGLRGHLGGLDLSVDFKAELAVVASLDPVPGAREEKVLLFEDFGGGGMGSLSKVPETKGIWETDPVTGVIRVHGVDGISRAVTSVNASSYTIETRMRFTGWEGKVIYSNAEANETARVDLMASENTVRLQTGIFGNSTIWLSPYPLSADTWYEVRIELGDGVVSVHVDGNLIFDHIPLGAAEPDGVIGFGSYGKLHQAEFDFVRVTEGGSRLRVVDPTARLWAQMKADALETELAEDPTRGDLYGAILALGLRYQIATVTSAWFTGEGSLVVIPPPVRFGRPDPITTAVADEVADPRESVNEFGTDDEPLVLTGNVPNPFNASTTISVLAGDKWSREGVSIAIYSVTGQLVRRLAKTALLPGENRLRWDGRDEGGNSVASGIYIYVLHDVRRRQFGKMMLLR